MMENAGLNLSREVAQLAYARDDEDGIRVLGLVGLGNNGGDTLVALAHLAGKGPLGFAAMRKKIGTTPYLFL
jgi:NAD(P)H-hydrate repair Nnr-like enzyme with NAD(P)H-hydrate epimerase domain